MIRRTRLPKVVNKLVAVRSSAFSCNKSPLFTSVNKNSVVNQSIKPLLQTRFISSEHPSSEQLGIIDLMKEVARQQQENIANVVPWFINNMPPDYLRDVPEHIRIQHLKAVSSINDLSDTDLRLTLKSFGKGSIQITKIRNQTSTGAFFDQIQKLEVPEGYLLNNVHIYSTLDRKIGLNIFDFIKEDLVLTTECVSAKREDLGFVKKFIAEVKQGKFAEDPKVPAYSEAFSDTAMDEYSSKLSPMYVNYMKDRPRRFMAHKEMYEKVRGTEDSSVMIEERNRVKDGEVNDSHWVTIASANVLPEVLLRISSAIFSTRKVDIVGARMDSILDPENSTPDLKGKVSLVQVMVQAEESPDGQDPLREGSDFWATMMRDLRRAKWLDATTLEFGLLSHPEVGLARAEIITCLCSMIHSPLYNIDAQTFPSIKSILQSIDSKPIHLQIACSIADLFLARFNPADPLDGAAYEAQCQNISSKIATMQFHGAKITLNKMLQAVTATLRTNVHHERRYALSLRVDPSIMFVPASSPAPPTKEDNVIWCMDKGTEVYKPLPFGLFFVHGRHFNAFHNRFRDIARGGLRLVTPPNSEQYAHESARQFDEVYGLSYAQQLKNKDIPEGGAKGVILVNTSNIKEQNKFFAMRKSVKGFADAMLDLIVKESTSNLVDHYGKDELIYFGPDEQIINSDIDWVTERAKIRGYPIPAAFMSSKSDAGFNHKEFGVTSEGVVVFLDVALKRSLGIDPKTDPFTIKITGGPDGDVAGNLMKILIREYGDNCKVVGIADGFGVAEDPNGLNSQELLRLVVEGVPITAFDTSKLGSEGIMMKADTEEGITRRNSMYYRVKADAFVPAGGRPNTMNGENWHRFIDEETGKSSAPLIVEGANIFTTPEARLALFEKAEVAIVKDSSANKCGVITSSCEIAASMLLTKEEFIENKAELVEDVLHLLRERARLEGELLFRSYSNYPGNLPHFSERISFAIGKVTDAVTDALQDVDANDPLFKELLPLIAEGLPKKLVELADDRITTHFPLQYQKNAMASTLASKLVYHEGIHLVESQPEDRIAERAMMYYRAEQEMKQLVSTLEASGGSNSQAVDLIKKGGTRSLLGFF